MHQEEESMQVKTQNPSQASQQAGAGQEGVVGV